MAHTITPFTFGQSTIRTTTIGDAVWFVATDVCTALEYRNTSDAIATHLDEDERSTIANGESRNGGGQLVIINESGLYALVLRSRKPAARKFAKWVTGEVLPTIRKTGSYSQQAPSSPLSPPEPQYFNFKLTVRIDGEEQYGHLTPLPEGSLCTSREGFVRALEDPASFNPEFISGLTRALLKRMERHEQRMKFLKAKLGALTP